MYEKIKLFFKWFFIISGIIIAELLILFLYAAYGKSLSDRSKTTYPPTTPGIEYLINQFRERIEQQTTIIQSTLDESDRIRKALIIAEKRIDNITLRNNILEKLNQEAKTILEKIGTSNVNSTAIIIRLKEINKEIENGINNLPDCGNN